MICFQGVEKGCIGSKWVKIKKLSKQVQFTGKIDDPLDTQPYDEPAEHAHMTYV